MSTAILIMGESSTGKTTSMRTLDPATTYYIDADRKGLSWKNWRADYSVENKNYLKDSNVNKIRSVIKNIAEKAPDIKVVVVDTLNAIMIDEEMRRMKEKNYDKWVEIAMYVWELVSESHMYHDDLTIIFVGHAETKCEDNGYMWTHLRTSGRKLEKICIESKFNVVFLAKCINGKYLFETRSKNSTAKTPMGVFDEFEIPNNMNTILKKLEEF